MLCNRSGKRETKDKNPTLLLSDMVPSAPSPSFWHLPLCFSSTVVDSRSISKNRHYFLYVAYFIQTEFCHPTYIVANGRISSPFSKSNVCSKITLCSLYKAMGFIIVTPMCVNPCIIFTPFRPHHASFLFHQPRSTFMTLPNSTHEERHMILVLQCLAYFP